MARTYTSKARTKKPAEENKPVIDIGEEIPKELGELYPKFLGYYPIDHTKHRLRPNDCFVDISAEARNQLVTRSLRPMHYCPYYGDFMSVGCIIADGIQQNSQDVTNYLASMGRKAKNMVVYRRKKAFFKPVGALDDWSNVFFTILQFNDHSLSILPGDLIVNYCVENPETGENVDMATAKQVADAFNGASHIITVDDSSPLLEVTNHQMLVAALKNSSWHSGYYILRPIVAGPYGIQRRLPTNRLYSNPTPLP